MRGVLFFLFTLAFITLSCECQKPQPANQTTPGKTGGTLVSSLATDVDNLNPILSQTAAASDLEGFLYLSLFRTDENFKIRTSEYMPCLAKSWRFSEDFKEITFYLEEEAKWSDGQPITAHDLKFTYDLMTDPTIPYLGRSQFDFVEACEVKGDHELIFRFREVYANELIDVGMTPLPRHVFENVSSEEFLTHPFNENPTVVSGPYRLKKWDRNQTIELEVNPNYSFKRPNLDRIVFRIIQDETSRLTNLKTGEIDLMVSMPPHQVEDLKNNYPEINVLTYSGTRYDYIGWLNTHPLFENRTVRRALTMAINRQEMVDALYYGFAEECVSPVHPAHADFYNPNLEPIPYDPEQAKQMLAEVGWVDRNNDGVLDRDGRDFSFTIKTNVSNKQRVDALTMIQSYLSKVGIRVRPEVLEFNVLIAQQTERDYEALISGWSMGTRFDPTNIWHSRSIVNGYNEHNYSNATVDSLIDLGRRTLDKDKARDIWYEFQEILYADQPYTFLFVRDNVDGLNRKFKNVKTWPRGIYFNVEEWWIEEE